MGPTKDVEFRSKDGIGGADVGRRDRPDGDQATPAATLGVSSRVQEGEREEGRGGTGADGEVEGGLG